MSLLRLQSGEESSPFVMGHVNCSRDATRLDDCSYTGPGEDVGCQYQDRSAGVLCYRTTGERRGRRANISSRKWCDKAAWQFLCG